MKEKLTHSLESLGGVAHVGHVRSTKITLAVFFLHLVSMVADLHPSIEKPPKGTQCSDLCDMRATAKVAHWVSG